MTLSKAKTRAFARQIKETWQKRRIEIKVYPKGRKRPIRVTVDAEVSDVWAVHRTLKLDADGNYVTMTGSKYGNVITFAPTGQALITLRGRWRGDATRLVDEMREDLGRAARAQTQRTLKKHLPVITAWLRERGVAK